MRVNDGDEALTGLADVEQIGGQAVGQGAPEEGRGVLAVVAGALAVGLSRGVPPDLLIERLRGGLDVAAPGLSRSTRGSAAT